MIIEFTIRTEKMNHTAKINLGDLDLYEDKKKIIEIEGGKLMEAAIKELNKNA